MNCYIVPAKPDIWNTYIDNLYNDKNGKNGLQQGISALSAAHFLCLMLKLHKNIVKIMLKMTLKNHLILNV